MPTKKITDTEVGVFLTRTLCERYGVRVHKISKDSTIAADLGVDGDDAKELLEELERRFCVDLEDILLKSFWPEAGLIFSSCVTPISIEELSRIITSRVHKAASVT